MRIGSQISALDSYRKYSVNSERANGKTDDTGSIRRAENKASGAMGLLNSGRMRAANRGLNETSRKNQESISLIQTAEDTLQKAGTALKNMRGLAERAANAANNSDDLVALDLEYSQYIFELSRLSMIKFNGIDLISTEKPVLISAVNSDTGETAGVTIDALKLETLGSIGSAGNAKDAVSAVDNAMTGVSVARERLSDVRTSIENKSRNVDIPEDKQQGSQRRVRDADYAKALAERMRSSMLSQPSVSMNAQANAAPVGVLQLLTW